MGKSKNKTLTSDSISALVLPKPNGNGKVSYETLPPTPEQLALFAVDVTSVSTLNDKMRAILTLIEDVLADPKDIYVIRERLRDRDDVLDIKTLFSRVRKIMRDETGFPTKPQSDSSSSPSSTGGRSTGRVQAGE